MARGTVRCGLPPLIFAVNVPVFAAGNVDTSQITGGFDAIYQVIAAIVSSIGTIFLLWGLFEWAQSLNTQDGGAQSIAFKRIGSGLVATLAPQIITVIRTGLPNS